MEARPFHDAAPVDGQHGGVEPASEVGVDDVRSEDRRSVGHGGLQEANRLREELGRDGGLFGGEPPPGLRRFERRAPPFDHYPVEGFEDEGGRGRQQVVPVSHDRQDGETEHRPEPAFDEGAALER